MRHASHTVCEKLSLKMLYPERVKNCIVCVNLGTLPVLEASSLLQWTIWLEVGIKNLKDTIKLSYTKLDDILDVGCHACKA